MTKKDFSNLTSDESIELRTAWAYERTLLANERTFIAWLRTGLAVTAASVIIVRLLSNVEPSWLVNTLAIVMAFSGMMIVALSAWGHQRMDRDLGEIAPGLIPRWLIWILTIALEASAITILILLIIG